MISVRVAVPVLVVAAASPSAGAAAIAMTVSACGEGPSDVQHAVLEREVEDLREAVARLERGEPILPQGDVIVVLGEDFVQDLLAAQLPFEIDLDRLFVRLDRAAVAFRVRPAVTLEGSVARKRGAPFIAQVRVLGAIDDIAIDLATGTLQASMRVDQVEVLEAGGLERILRGAGLAGLDRFLRSALQGLIPPIRIPVQTEERLVLPAVTDGPVRLAAATLRIRGAVSGVFAGLGQLWVSLRVGVEEVAGAPPLRTAPASVPGGAMSPSPQGPR